MYETKLKNLIKKFFALRQRRQESGFSSTNAGCICKRVQKGAKCWVRL